MAGYAQAQACMTNSAEPCAALPARREDATNETGCSCAVRVSGAPEALGQATEAEALAGDLAHDLNNLLSIITTYTLLVLEDLESDDPSRADLEEVCRASARARELTRELPALGRRSSSIVPLP